LIIINSKHVDLIPKEKLYAVTFKWFHLFEMFWIFIAYKFGYNTIAFLMFIELGFFVLILSSVNEIKKKIMREKENE
jgi:hypothetical protein